MIPVSVTGPVRDRLGRLVPGARVVARPADAVLTAQGRGAGAATLVAVSADIGGVVTLSLWAPPRGTAVWSVRVTAAVEGGASDGEAFEVEVSAYDAPAVALDALRLRGDQAAAVAAKAAVLYPEPLAELESGEVVGSTVVLTMSDGRVVDFDLPPTSAPDPYVHNQLAAAAEWTVAHNLGRPAPTIVVVDSSGRAVGCRVLYPDSNTLVLQFGAANSGVVYVYP